jgi:hypothetical protein
MMIFVRTLDGVARIPPTCGIRSIFSFPSSRPGATQLKRRLRRSPKVSETKEALGRKTAEGLCLWQMRGEWKER